MTQNEMITSLVEWLKLQKWNEHHRVRFDHTNEPAGAEELAFYIGSKQRGGRARAAYWTGRHIDNARG